MADEYIGVIIGTSKFNKVSAVKLQGKNWTEYADKLSDYSSTPRLSDQTLVGGLSWKILKYTVMKPGFSWKDDWIVSHLKYDKSNADFLPDYISTT